MTWCCSRISLDHFSAATCEASSTRFIGCLAPDGRVITLEFVPNDDRVTPPPVEFSLIMLATTPEGDAYTFKEYEHMFGALAFPRTELHPVLHSGSNRCWCPTSHGTIRQCVRPLFNLEGGREAGLFLTMKMEPATVVTLVAEQPTPKGRPRPWSVGGSNVWKPRITSAGRSVIGGHWKKETARGHAGIRSFFVRGCRVGRRRAGFFEVFSGLGQRSRHFGPTPHRARLCESESLDPTLRTDVSNPRNRLSFRQLLRTGPRRKIAPPVAGTVDSSRNRRCTS